VKVASTVREQVFGREVDYQVSFIVSAARKPIFGFLGMIYAMFSIGVLGFIVWRA
jgi:hypothetical protein